jgi:hypothetical protein
MAMPTQGKTGPQLGDYYEREKHCVGQLHDPSRFPIVPAEVRVSVGIQR